MNSIRWVGSRFDRSMYIFYLDNPVRTRRGWFSFVALEKQPGHSADFIGA